jgi:hypothetical protein
MWREARVDVATKEVIEPFIPSDEISGHSKSPSGASAMVLLSLYLEAQTLPGDKAQSLVTNIGKWHREAICGMFVMRR